jgi:hypothetical protein
MPHPASLNHPARDLSCISTCQSHSHPSPHHNGANMESPGPHSPPPSLPSATLTLPLSLTGRVHAARCPATRKPKNIRTQPDAAAGLIPLAAASVKHHPLPGRVSSSDIRNPAPVNRGKEVTPSPSAIPISCGIPHCTRDAHTRCALPPLSAQSSASTHARSAPKMCAIAWNYKKVHP